MAARNQPPPSVHPSIARAIAFAHRAGEFRLAVTAHPKQADTFAAAAEINTAKANRELDAFAIYHDQEPSR